MKYTYFKTDKGIEVIQFGDYRVEQPFFQLISDITQPNFKVFNDDLLCQLITKWNLKSSKNQTQFDLEELVDSDSAPLFQRLFAFYYLNLRLNKDIFFVTELESYINAKESTSVALIDFVDILLNESNPIYSEIRLSERLTMLFSVSSAKDILNSYIQNGYQTQFSCIDNELVEIISAGNPVSFMIAIVQYYLAKQIIIKRCKNCDRFFIPSRLSQDYCDYIAPHYTDKTCRDIGAIKNFAEKKSEDEAYQLYSKYYKRVYRYVSTGKLSKEDFQNWNISATLGRDSVQAGKLSLNKYTEKLDKLFTEVLTHTK